MAFFFKKGPPQIPDHELIRCVGKGSYGEVWLARNVMGTYRAVKIVHRKSFEESRPFEREFEGIQKFEPVSRTHPGLVAVLHVGRNIRAGYFYYVMEVGDDVATGQTIHPDRYVPMTLRSEMERHGKLPPADCLPISLALTSALGHLHQQGLIHRDIKPSNIIFVNGIPKFADIGLVTDIRESATYLGTVGYMPPEGVGNPTGDIYSLGKVLYEMVMGQTREDCSALQTGVAVVASSPVTHLHEIILKACDGDSQKRFQSATEMYAALAGAGLASSRPQKPEAGLPAPEHPVRMETPEPGATSGPARRKTFRVSILHKSNVETDDHVLRLVEQHLTRAGCQVFIDKHLAIGVQWAREIENKVRDSDAAIVLLSAASVQSEMILHEVEIAHQAAEQQGGRPKLLPVRIQLASPLPGALAAILDPLPCLRWENAQDDQRLIHELLRALQTPRKAAAPEARVRFESIGGAVPLDSEFYVVRPTDDHFQSAMARGDSIVLVKGARQMGKTSLLARGLQQARQAGAKVVLTDFQKLNASHLISIEAFFLALGDSLAEQLDLDVLPEAAWDKRRSPNSNFERYLRREVLGSLSGHFVWGLDEVDRLFTCDFGSEVFGLFRSWHNERALDPSGPWSRVTLAIAYATEAHLFITDVNQSPFNVGTRLTLDDFTFDQVANLNQRYGSPLRDDAEISRFFALVGGQPYLVRRGLAEMTSGHVAFAEFAQSADRDEGIMGDHLRRILVVLARDQELTEVVRAVLRGLPCPDSTSFYRLRSAGVMAGDSPQQVRPRCEIYATYLKQHLL
jgi:serine/threonine protein kinase